LYENFGFDFAEDQVENTPQIILGEANYKKWVNGVDPNNMLNRQVSLRANAITLLMGQTLIRKRYNVGPDWWSPYLAFNRLIA